MNARNPSPAPDAVVAEIDIAASPERVFAALTDPRQLLAWWGRESSVAPTLCEMDARPGGRWRLRWKPVAGVAQGAVGDQLRRNGEQEFEAHGQVLEYEPPALLVWSWIANWHEESSHETVVRWELSEAAGGTRVRVTHSALSGESIARADYTKGWLGVLGLLRDHFATLSGDTGVMRERDAASSN